MGPELQAPPEATVVGVSEPNNHTNNESNETAKVVEAQSVFAKDAGIDQVLWWTQQAAVVALTATVIIGGKRQLV